VDSRVESRLLHSVKERPRTVATSHGLNGSTTTGHACRRIRSSSSAGEKPLACLAKACRGGWTSDTAPARLKRSTCSLRRAKTVPVCEALPGLHHYDVIHDLVDARMRLNALAIDLLDLGPAWETAAIVGCGL